MTRVVWCVNALPQICLEEQSWAAWAQAGLSVLAILVAVLVPAIAAWRTERRLFRGQLETIAVDVRIAAQLGQIYLTAEVPVPGYRLPLFGAAGALPAAIASGRLSAAEALDLAQFHTDAVSFNRCLDLAQGLLDRGMDSHDEVLRLVTKAQHLIPGRVDSHYGPAARVLRRHLPRSSLARTLLPDEKIEPLPG